MEKNVDTTKPYFASPLALRHIEVPLYIQWISSEGIHYAKNSENFSPKSNGEVCFGSVQPENSGPPVEVVHFDRSKLVFCSLLHSRFWDVTQRSPKEFEQPFL